MNGSAPMTGAAALTGAAPMTGAEPLTLVSHHLCPYVQRAAIALREKGAAFERIDVDLSKKPDWFLALSPLGKTPVLKVGTHAIFESAVILEYLEETQPHPLHARDPLVRAEQRAWVAFSSAVLNDIAGFYSAGNAQDFELKIAALNEKFARLEQRLGERLSGDGPCFGGPYFGGEPFSLVDAAFGPVFRYFDVFEQAGDVGILEGKPRIAAWRTALSDRPSVQAAVTPDYPSRLRQFLEARGSHLSRLMKSAA